LKSTSTSSTFKFNLTSNTCYPFGNQTSTDWKSGEHSRQKTRRMRSRMRFRAKGRQSYCQQPNVARDRLVAMATCLAVGQVVNTVTRLYLSMSVSLCVDVSVSIAKISSPTSSLVACRHRPKERPKFLETYHPFPFLIVQSVQLRKWRCGPKILNTVTRVRPSLHCPMLTLFKIYERQRENFKSLSKGLNSKVNIKS